MGVAILQMTKTSNETFFEVIKEHTYKSLQNSFHKSSE